MILELTITSDEVHIYVSNNHDEEFTFKRPDLIKCEKKNGFVVVLMQQGNKEEERDLSIDGAEGSIMIVSIDGNEPTDLADLKTMIDNLMI